MMGTSHMLSGVITGSVVACAGDLPPAQAVAFIGITSVCALLPDMDHPDARLPRMLGWPGRALAAIISAVFGHRTLTHSVLGVGLLSVGLAFIPGLPGYMSWAILLGCVTHILGDMLTVSGVRIWWPHRAVWRLGRMRVNGHFEQLVMTPLLAVGAAASVGLVVATSG